MCSEGCPTARAVIRTDAQRGASFKLSPAAAGRAPPNPILSANGSRAIRQLRRTDQSLRQQGRNVYAPFPFPPRKSRGGRVPPTPQKRRLAPQEGKPPCAIPKTDAQDFR